MRLDETVAEVTPDEVRFASGEVLPTRTVIWAAGVRATRWPRPWASPPRGAAASRWARIWP